MKNFKNYSHTTTLLAHHTQNYIVSTQVIGEKQKIKIKHQPTNPPTRPFRPSKDHGRK